jgi:putative isomerase
MNYKDTLDIKANPSIDLNFKNLNNKYNLFSDMGAWHGYYLPTYENENLYGGFPGPMIIAQEYPVNLSDSISKIEITNTNNNKIYKLSESKNIKLNYYPGKLCQSYELEDFNIELELIFASNRSALIKSTIKNNKSKDLNLKIGFKGSIFNKYLSLKDNKLKNCKQSLEKTQNGVKVLFSDIVDNTAFFSTKETVFEIRYSIEVNTIIDLNTYKSISKDNINIKANKSSSIYSTHSYTFTKKEYENEQLIIDDILLNPKLHFGKNNNRWNLYIKTIEDKKNVPIKYKNATVKCINTLMTNYRSSAGALKHGGIIPSISYHYFNGLWAWDSFKQAVAVAKFDSSIAKENIKALFDYQIKEDDKLRPKDSGAIIDCIFYNKSKDRDGVGVNWNERNSKTTTSYMGSIQCL